MAKKKKARVPAPPKRTVQAPAARKAAPRDPRRTRMLLIGIGAAIVVAAAVVGIVMAAGGGGGGPAAGPSGTCQRETIPPQGRQHVQELAENFEYSSTPPTSGPHFGSPAIWNLYEQPIEPFRVVHNLEHGGAVVQYGSGVPQADVAQLAEWYADDPRGLIVAPLPPELEEEQAALENQIVATAWTHLMTCPGFDEGALDQFLDDYRGPQGDAPEKLPLDALQPGAP